jgi:hypothetical protein
MTYWDNARYAAPTRAAVRQRDTAPASGTDGVGTTLVRSDGDR